MSGTRGNYAALGSSFAAGPGLRPRAPGSSRLSGRSSANYAHILAGRLDLNLRDVTYSGATTADLVKKSAKGARPQVDALSSATDLITVTAGGNDVGYLPTLTLSSLPGPVQAFPSLRRRLAASKDPFLLNSRFDSLGEGLTAVVKESRRRSPNARIVLVDYLTILPPVSDGSLGSLSADVVAWARDCAARLSTTMQAVATAEGCDFLAVSEASRNHHAWSVEPWTRRFHVTLRGGAAYHPNAAGMKAVAALLGKLLADQTGKTP